MVHPGIIVAGVFGVVLTGVVIYEIFKEEFNDFLESFEKPSPVGYGYERPRDQREQDQRGQHSFEQDEHDHRQGHSSSMYQADYELRQRRTLRQDDDEKQDEADVSRMIFVFLFTWVGTTGKDMQQPPGSSYPCVLPSSFFFFSLLDPFFLSCICILFLAHSPFHALAQSTLHTKVEKECLFHYAKATLLPLLPFLPTLA